MLDTPSAGILKKASEENKPIFLLQLLHQWLVDAWTHGREDTFL